MPVIVGVTVDRLTSPSDQNRYTLEECGSHSGEVSIRAQSFPDFLQGILYFREFIFFEFCIAVSSVASNRPQTSNSFKLKTTNLVAPGLQSVKPLPGLEVLRASVDTRYRVHLPNSVSGSAAQACPSDVFPSKNLSSAEGTVSPAYI